MIPRWLGFASAALTVLTLVWLVLLIGSVAAGRVASSAQQALAILPARHWTYEATYLNAALLTGLTAVWFVGGLSLLSRSGAGRRARRPGVRSGVLLSCATRLRQEHRPGQAAPMVAAQSCDVE